MALLSVSALGDPPTDIRRHFCLGNGPIWNSYDVAKHQHRTYFMAFCMMIILASQKSFIKFSIPLWSHESWISDFIFCKLVVLKYLVQNLSPSSQFRPVKGKESEW